MPLQIKPDKLLKSVQSGNFNDDEFKELFPPRTDTDLAIRRGRAHTVYNLYKKTKRTSEWEYWIPKLVNLDYITVCILMLCEHIHTKWLWFWNRMQCLTSLDDLQTATKWVSDKLKKGRTTMKMRLRYCEAGGVSGYRNPPFGKFDFLEESRKLAEAGEEHGLLGTDWLELFTRHAIEVQGLSAPKSVEFMTLEQFIESDLAMTGGSSTFGKVEWEFEGEKGKFKARKNFLLDIATPAYLAQETVRHLGTQTNKSFIKPELGKMRVAVTGDLWTYFSQSWLNYLTGEVYLQWPGNTLDERLGEQVARMSEMQEAGKGYALPFDFAAFDHQPTLDEVKILVQKFLQRGKVNVPDAHLPFWENMMSKTVHSFSNAFLIARVNETIHKWLITGGVESGIRLTSLLGNYWNNVMTSISKELVHDAGYHGELKSWLRGDDSAIYSESYWGVLAMRLAYMGINAVGNDSKYGIHLRNSEFLRVWYTPEKCFGYPNRAIPGILQRKPWSSEPWDPEGVIKAQLSTIDTLERRLGTDLSALRDTVAEDWSKIRHKSVAWLRLPVVLGGLGLMPFSGKVCSTFWPKVDKPKIRFITEEQSYKRIQNEFEEYGLTEHEAKEIQQDRMRSKAASDDIRGLGKKFRSEYDIALKQIKNERWSRTDVKPFTPDALFTMRKYLSSISNQDDLSATIGTVGSGFGSARKIQAWWTKIQELSRYRKIRPIRELQRYSPDTWRLVRHLERKGLHRASALDYAFGKIAGLVVSPLHPMLASAIQSAISVAVTSWVEGNQKWDRITWGWLTSNTATMFAHSLNNSRLATSLFQW